LSIPCEHVTANAVLPSGPWTGRLPWCEQPAVKTRPTERTMAAKNDDGMDARNMTEKLLNLSERASTYEACSPSCTRDADAPFSPSAAPAGPPRGGARRTAHGPRARSRPGTCGRASPQALHPKRHRAPTLKRRAARSRPGPVGG
jgi:hypothetical protein